MNRNITVPEKDVEENVGDSKCHNIIYWILLINVTFLLTSGPVFGDTEYCSTMDGLCYAWAWSINDTPGYYVQAYPSNYEFDDPSCSLIYSKDTRTAGYFYKTNIRRYKWDGGWVQSGYWVDDYVTAEMKQYVESEFEKRGVPENTAPSTYWPNGPPGDCGYDECGLSTRKQKLADGCENSETDICYAWSWSVRDIPKHYVQAYPSNYEFDDTSCSLITIPRWQEEWLFVSN